MDVFIVVDIIVWDASNRSKGIVLADQIGGKVGVFDNVSFQKVDGIGKFLEKKRRCPVGAGS